MRKEEGVEGGICIGEGVSEGMTVGFEERGWGWIGWGGDEIELGGGVETEMGRFNGS